MNPNQNQEALQCLNSLLASKEKVEEATRMAAKIKQETLGRNEKRLMQFAATVLQGLKEVNFPLIAAATLQLLQDQAVAQVVGWSSVESMRQKAELMDLGLSKDQADELCMMKSSERRTQGSSRFRHQFRSGSQREKDSGGATNQSSKEKSPMPPPKKK